jgi:ELWxxDGT repeat protein
LGDLAVFTAFDFDHGEEVWVTDGTPQGTQPLVDLCPGDCWSLPRILGTVGDKLLFSASASGPTGDYRLWATDGLEVHPVGVDTIRPEVVSPEAIDGWLYFERGFEVWRSDGDMLERASDFPGGANRVPGQLFAIGSRAFAYRDGFFSSPHDLWEVHPTSQEVLRGCSPPAGWLSNFVVDVDDDDAYFGAGCVAGLPDLGPGLFRTDGSPGATVRIKTFEGAPVSLLLGAGGFFLIERLLEPGGAVVDRIWRSDGTAAGTVPLTEFVPAWTRLVLSLGDRHLLFYTDRLRSLDLSTGTIADLPIPSAGPATIDPSGSFALFGSRTGWWLTYGTPDTTFQVFTTDPLRPQTFAATFLRDRVVFSGDDGVHGEDIWVLGLPNALAIPALGWPGVALLALLLAAAAVHVLRR